MMKFAKLLLESYGVLNEGPNDGLMWLTGQPVPPANAPESVLNHPNPDAASKVSNPTITLYTSPQDNMPRAKGGPFGDQARQINNLSPEDRSKINNWFAGEEEGGTGGGQEELGAEAESQDPFDLDPILSSLPQVDRDRWVKIEEAMPGTTQKFKELYTNAAGLVEDAGPSKMFKEKFSDRVLFQKIFGGKSKGSLAWALESQIDAGAVRIDRTKSVAFALDPIPVSELSGAVDSMVDFSKAYAKSRNCDMDDVDSFSKVVSNVRQDPDSGSFFFSTPIDDKKFGISLSVAEQNPLNLMANAYNSNVSGCTEGREDLEDYSIPQKKIEAAYTNDSGNTGNIVKELSENLKVAAFMVYTGDKEGAAEIIREGVSKFGKRAFDALIMKRNVESGVSPLDEMYSEVLDTVSEMGIVDRDTVKEYISGPLRNYMLESLEFMETIKPDYAARVGGVAGKGDKSDVDYVWKEERDLEGDTGGVGMEEVKFEDLAPEMQKAIEDSGDTIQDSYWVLPDSLKSYVKEGDIKVGEASSLKTESERLLEDGNTHGDFVWNNLLEGYSDDDKAAAIAGGRRVLKRMNDTSETIQKLMGPFTTSTFKNAGQARAFVKDQLKKIIPGVKGINNLANDIIDVWEKDGSQKAIGMMDRELQMMILEGSIVRNRKGEIDKQKSRDGLLAIAALQASMGVDSTGRKVMSEIHILSTGNTYRGEQNKTILDPLKELIDPKSDRGLDMGKSIIRVDDDGAMKFIPGKGKASGQSTVNTRTSQFKSKKK